MKLSELKTLGSKIKKAIRTKEGYEVLDSFGGQLWDEGGCWVLAHAIKKEFGGELYAIVFGDDIAQHVVVKFKDLGYLDGDGFQTEDKLSLRWFKNFKSAPELIPLEYSVDDEILCDRSAIRKVQELLRKKIKNS